MSGRGSSHGSSSSPNRSHHRRFPSLTAPPSNNTPPPPPDLACHHAPGLYTAPLLLTVRFPSSIDDILLDIPHPNETTVVALKNLIRSRLQQPDSQKRLRFIHNGRMLPDNAVLGSVLRPLPPPPRDDRMSDPKGKGKAVQGASHQPPPQRVYIICSIDMQLTDAELADEKRLAEEPPPAQPSSRGTGSPFYPTGSSRHSPGLDTGAVGGGRGLGGTETPLLVESGPRGFDRLLSAGMSAAEVNQLRLSFRSMHESRNTADTMPSPDTLRDMEDAWLDNNNDAGVNTAANPTDITEGATGGGDDFGLPGVLDLLFKGMFIGFVWPLGAIAWLVRGDEEKIPKRMRMFVYFGFVLSLLVGTIRVIG